MKRVEWRIDTIPVAYPDAVAAMEKRVAAIREGHAAELVWLLEHPALFTAGTSARDEDLLDPLGLPVFKSGRGGQYTYHGPGQRIAYVLLDLAARDRDVRAHVRRLEHWLSAVLAELGVRGERRADRVGLWVEHGGGEAKIAAIGVRIRHWVTYHGVSLNVAPNLDHYRGIVPCGIREHGVTSLSDLGVEVTMDEIDRAARKTFDAVFGS
jgi:lipoyl(octanoyl) transferase